MKQKVTPLEAVVTDYTTLKIVEWVVQDHEASAESPDEMERYLSRDITEYDRNKIRLVLGELFATRGNKLKAMQYIRQLQNLPTFEYWANSRIQSLGKGIS
jgi:hypothetical protein